MLSEEQFMRIQILEAKPCSCPVLCVSMMHAHVYCMYVFVHYMRTAMAHYTGINRYPNL